MGNSRSIVGACCAAVLCQTAAWASGPVAVDPDAGLPLVTSLNVRSFESVSPVDGGTLAGSGDCEEIGGFSRRFQAANRLRGNWYEVETAGVLTQIKMFLDLDGGPTDLTFFVYKKRPAETNLFDLLWAGLLPADEEGPLYYASPPVNGGELLLEAGASYVIGVGWGSTNVIFGRSEDGIGPFSKGQVLGIVGIEQAPPPPDPEGGYEFRDPFEAGMYAAELCFAPETGACCSGIDCTNGLNATECLDGGGEFAGPNTTCADVVCPLPKRACCVGSACLDELTRFQCENIEGGEFFEDMRCVQEPCSPRGACCTDDGCTEAVTELQCVDDLQGVYRGDGSECGDFPGCNAGACCLGDFCGRGMTEQACLDAGGAYRGPASTCDAGICDPQGACCLPDGSCQDAISPSSCAGMGGTFRGDDSECAALDPVCGKGACCDVTGCIDNLTESFCSGAPIRGTWRGEGSTCDTLDPHCEGSCCRGANQDVCEQDDWTPELCDAVNGVFLGYSVECDPEDEPLTCPVDASVDCCLPNTYTCVEAESGDVCAAIGGTVVTDCDRQCVECLDNGDCDDGVFCNGAETCTGDACQPGADPCPGQACHEDTDSCVECLSDTDCPGGLVCDSDNNVCVGCVVDGDCNDRNACTTDACEANACVFTNVQDGTACADGDFCNGDETCDTGECVGGADPCVDRGHCDEGADTCLDCIADAECSDDEFCNGAETCVDNVCNLDVPGPCEDDAHCDEEGDACFECVEDAECSDGLFCNGAETCVDNVCNLDVPDPCINAVHCDEEADVCLECIGDSECRDDIFCNGLESCVENVCVVEPACEEGELCDEDNQICAECFEHEDCDDGNICTIDLCSSESTCDHFPDTERNGESCDDGLFCTENETCDGVLCEGQDLVCPEGESCDEELDMCVRVGCGRDPVWMCDGDVDGDGQVNPVDSGLVQARFGSVDEQDLCNYDVDCDGQINPVDSGIVQSLFGVCDAPRAECE